MPECSISVDTTGPSNTCSWEIFWAAAVAINGMCVVHGTMGVAGGLGKLSDCSASLKFRKAYVCS